MLLWKHQPWTISYPRMYEPEAMTREKTAWCTIAPPHWKYTLKGSLRMHSLKPQRAAYIMFTVFEYHASLYNKLYVNLKSEIIKGMW
jgi:hypothetical protein